MIEVTVRHTSGDFLCHLTPRINAPASNKQSISKLGQLALSLEFSVELSEGTGSMPARARKNPTFN
jgi:hypothetical protein